MHSALVVAQWTGNGDCCQRVVVIQHTLLEPLPSCSAAWPGHNIVQEHHDSFVRGEPLAVEDDAEWLVRFYDSFAVFAKNSDVTEKALSALSQVKVWGQSWGGQAWQGKQRASVHERSHCAAPPLLPPPCSPAGLLCLCGVRQLNQARVGGTRCGRSAAALLGGHWCACWPPRLPTPVQCMLLQCWAKT